jgi:hypothetical protein
MARRRRAVAAEVAVESRRAVELRRGGAGVDEIAYALGVSPRTAQRRVAEGYRLVLGEEVAASAVRAEVEDRLNGILRRAEQRLRTRGIEPIDEQRWCRLILQTEATRMRLLGLSVPSVATMAAEAAGLDSAEPPADDAGGGW